ncbi:hypothetical protein [Sinomonas atrocyanea]
MVESVTGLGQEPVREVNPGWRSAGAGIEPAPARAAVENGADGRSPRRGGRPRQGAPRRAGTQGKDRTGDAAVQEPVVAAEIRRGVGSAPAPYAVPVHGRVPPGQEPAQTGGGLDQRALDLGAGQPSPARPSGEGSTASPTTYRLCPAAPSAARTAAPPAARAAPSSAHRQSAAGSPTAIAAIRARAAGGAPPGLAGGFTTAGRQVRSHAPIESTNPAQPCGAGQPAASGSKPRAMTVV